MPTTPLPLTARTHEDQHTFHPAPYPPSTSLVRPPFTLTLHFMSKMRGERRTRFPLPVIFNSLLKERSSPSLPLPLFPHLVLLSPPLSFSLSLLLLAVALMASICHCYIQDCLLHESRWEWGTDGGVEVGVRGGLKKIDYRNESESVLSIHSL